MDIKKLFLESNLKEIIAYHGTSKQHDFPALDKIYWVTPDKQLAGQYGDAAQVFRKDGSAIVYCYDVQVDHPATIDKNYISINGLLSAWYMNSQNKDAHKEALLDTKSKIIDHWHNIGLDNSTTSTHNHWFMSGPEGNKLLVKFLTLLGYDSILYKEDGVVTYGVFDQSKIKKINNQETLSERKSLDQKSEFNKLLISEMLDNIRNLKFFICKDLSMSFGVFTGIQVYTEFKHQYGTRVIFYIGFIDDLHGVGKAHSENNMSTVYVKNLNLVNDIDNVFVPNKKIYANEIDHEVASNSIYNIDDSSKRILYHELSHIFDMTQSEKSHKQDSTYPWHGRYEEFEAELNTLYNAMLDDIQRFDSKEDFESQFPLTYDGLRLMVNYYDTHIGSMIGRVKNDMDSSLTYKKIIKRLVEVRSKVLNKLPD